MRERCPLCDAPDVVTWTNKDQSFDVLTPQGLVTLTVRVPVGSCPLCNLEWTDYRGEEIRDNAARSIRSPEGK